MEGIHIALSDGTEPAAADVTVYRLASAQFGKYRPPSHEYLHLHIDPREPTWVPITDRIETIPGPATGRAILPTFTRPLPGRLDQLDEWYTTHHVPEVVAVPGFAAGRRYAAVSPFGPDQHVRLALYELVADDLGAALVRLQAALPSMVQTDALDSAAIASWLYVPLEAP